MTEATLPVLIEEREDGFYWKLDNDPRAEFLGPYPTQAAAIEAVEKAISDAYVGALNKMFGAN